MDESAPPVSFVKNYKNEIEQYKTRIAIDTRDLKCLEHKNLIELIQLIQSTCKLSLNDWRYIDKIYNIFKIIKNKEKDCYDIIINNKKNKNGQKIDIEKYNNEEEKEEEEEEEEEDEEEDDSEYKCDKKNSKINKNINDVDILKNDNENISFKDKEKQYNIYNCYNKKADMYKKNRMFQGINEKKQNKIKDFNNANINSNGWPKRYNTYYKNNYSYNFKSSIDKPFKFNNSQLKEDNKLKYNNNYFLEQNNNKDVNNNDSEEEKINNKFLSDKQKLIKNQGSKIGLKMREISINKKTIIKNLLKINDKTKLLEEMEKPETKKIIKEMRQEEIKKINNETKELLKSLQSERNKKLEEIRLQKNKEEREKEKLDKNEELKKSNQNSHTEDDKRFQCNICRKKFISKTALNGHFKDKKHIFKEKYF